MNKRSRENFLRVLNNTFMLTSSWVDSAISLHHAAEKLAKIWRKSMKGYTSSEKARWSEKAHWNRTLARPFMLLSAYSIENLIKGIILANTQTDSRLKVLNSFNHDLRRCWKKTKLPKTDEEDFLLGQLTDIIKYAGRYPFPKNEDRLSSAAEWPEGGLGPKLMFRKSDIGRVDRMFRKLLDECKKIMDSTGIRLRRRVHVHAKIAGPKI